MSKGVQFRASVDIATHLMRRLLAWAPRHGVREVIGEILAENAAMIDLARHLGFSLLHLPDDPQIIKAQLNLALGLPVAHG